MILFRQARTRAVCARLAPELRGQRSLVVVIRKGRKRRNAVIANDRRLLRAPARHHSRCCDLTSHTSNALAGGRKGAAVVKLRRSAWRPYRPLLGRRTVPGSGHSASCRIARKSLQRGGALRGDAILHENLTLSMQRYCLWIASNGRAKTTLRSASFHASMPSCTAAFSRSPVGTREDQKPPFFDRLPPSLYPRVCRAPPPLPYPIL